jgi:hypothetical protein
VPEQLQQLRDELEARTRELLEWQIHADVSAAATTAFWQCLGY